MGLVYYVYYRWCDPNAKCGLLAQVCFHQQQIETLEMRRKLCYKPVTTHKQKQKILVSKTLPVLDSVLTCQKSVCGNHPATLGLAFFILRSVNSKLRLQTMQRIQRQLPSTLTEKKCNLNMLMHTYIHLASMVESFCFFPLPQTSPYIHLCMCYCGKICQVNYHDVLMIQDEVTKLYRLSSNGMPTLQHWCNP